MGILEKLDALDRWAGGAPRPPSRGDRWFRYALGCLAAVLLLAYGGLTAWNSHHDRQVADRLRRDGSEVPGLIVDYRVPYHLKGAHEVRVEFDTVTGQHVETWVTVHDYRNPGPTRVRYLVADPSIARLANDLEPRSGDFLALVIIAVGLGALGFMVYRIGKSFDRRLGLAD